MQPPSGNAGEQSAGVSHAILGALDRAADVGRLLYGSPHATVANFGRPVSSSSFRRRRSYEIQSGNAHAPPSDHHGANAAIWSTRTAIQACWMHLTGVALLLFMATFDAHSHRRHCY